MTIFSRIIAGEIPCYKIAEDDEFFAFLDINPLTEGHTLVIPKREVDYYFDLTDGEISRINLFAKKIASKLKAATGCRKVAVSVMGLEVPHAHIHLIPMNNECDVNFAKEKLKLSPEQFASILDKVRL